MSRNLLILDINGLLCCKIPKNAIPPDNLPYIICPSYIVVFRPYYREFLEFCFANYDVGFFSSTTYANATVILDKLLTEQQNRSTVFQWFRDRTRPDLELGGYATIKCLSDVFREYPNWNYTKKDMTSGNTLICDDSIQKLRYNHRENMVIVDIFTGNDDDDYLLRLIDILRQRFKEINSKSKIYCVFETY